ncbi:hypothetical protein [Micromonospora sp. NPDC049891]|uniref:50S ribosomal protein bL37 n=1 Tax=Micromonospora sp. NPDC049891 TaxID=3155655 RepID=UPI0033EE4354
MSRRPVGAEQPREQPPRTAGTSINGSDPDAGKGDSAPGGGAVRSRSGHHEEVTMAKKARKKKARKKSAANHGKRPNS